MSSFVRRVTVLLLAVLLATAPIGVVVALPAPVSTADQDEDLTSVVSSRVDATENQPPLTQKENAIEIINQLKTPAPHLERRKDRIRRLLVGTIDEYRGDVRIRRGSVFNNDSQAIQALSKFDNTGQDTRVETAVQLIVSADNQTASQAITDAQRALKLAGDEISPRGKRVAAESHLRNAQRAFDHAQKILAKAKQQETLAKRTRTRARALRHLATAWRQAQKVIDKVDAGTSPEIHIRTRSDPVRNGTSETSRRIIGNIVDVQAYELSNITVQVNNRDPVVIPLQTPTAPTQNATFDFNVSFTQRNTTITATVIDVSVDETRDRQNNRRQHSKGQNRGQNSAAQSKQLDRDRLRLDGDGLSDTFEVTVVKTDPQDPDSDAGVTAADESDNGVLDGSEDFDNDTLVAYDESFLGTSPIAKDTDGDGLSDRVEVTYTQLDPTDSDSDDNGIGDAKDDPDSDGLSTEREVREGTTPFDADTDLDQLNDSAELEIHGTDPVKPDTDDDGLNDAVELTLGTNPTIPDTDGDGVIDGNETFETTTTEKATGVEVTLRGQGNAAAATEVTPQPDYFNESQEASVAPTVRIENNTAVKNATVRIPINESVPTNEYADLAVYKWNGSVQDQWTPLNTTIKNGSAIATVDSFSYFTVLDTDEWTGAISVDGSTGAGSPLALKSQPNFTCAGACNVTNTTTLLLGGEPSVRKITVEQGSKTFKIVPLSNGQSAENFYNYGDAELNAPLPIAKSDTSRLFLWSGPNGISLVALHDKPRDGSGGAVDLAFEGLPFNSGSWVVKDDSGDFRQGSRTEPHWSWTSDNTDGGAFRGNLTNQTITVTPSFNEEASGEPLTPGTMERWEVLTGQATAPRNESLALDQPVTIRIPGAPTENGSTVGPGDTGTANWSYDLSRSDRLTIFYQTEQTDVDPTATLSVTDENGDSVTEDLNIGTVGTVREVINLTELSGENATIEISVDGVNLRAEIAPGAGGVDSDGDGISDAVEFQRHTAANGRAETFMTDPFDNDTDNDGVIDGQEVTFRREAVAGELITTPILRSDPTEADTDGDGLTDGREYRGNYSFNITTSPSATENFAEATRTDVDPAQYLTTFETESSPYLADTDRDTIDDAVELANGTDPSNTDTDHDSISDRQEYRGSSDPTLFDTTAPTIEIRSLKANAQKTHYEVTYIVTDPSGINQLEFIKGGEVQKTRIFDGATDTGVVTTEFDVATDDVADVFEIFGRVVEESILGVKVTLRLTDVHGNSKQIIKRGPNVFGTLAKWVEKAIPVEELEISVLPTIGALSGLVVAVGQSVSDIIKMVSDPLKFLKDLSKFAKTIYKRPSIVKKLPKLFLDTVVSTQNRQNPFKISTADNATFAGSWYVGYAGGFILEAVFGSKGTSKLADTITDLSSTAKRLRKAYGSITTLIKGATVGRAKQVAIRYADELVDIGVSTRVGKAILETASAAKTFLVRQRLKFLGRGVIGGLSEPQQQFLGRIVKRTDADGIRGVRLLSQDGSLDELLNFGVCGVRTFAVGADGTGLRLPAQSKYAGYIKDGRLQRSNRVYNIGYLSTNAWTPLIQACNPKELDDDVVEVVGSRLPSLLGRGLIDLEEAKRVTDALDDPDVENDMIAEALAEGDDEAFRFIASLEEGEPGELAEFSKLSDELEISEKELKKFAQYTDSSGPAVLTKLDDDAIETLFKLESRFDLPADEAIIIRKRLAKFATSDVKPRITTQDINEFARDLQGLREAGFGDEAKTAYLDTVFQQDATDAGARNLRGDLQEATVARRLAEDDTVALEKLEFDDQGELSVDLTKADSTHWDDIKDDISDRNLPPDPTHAGTEIDIQTESALIESKFRTEGIDADTLEEIRVQVAKYRAYRDLVLNDPNRKIVVVINDMSSLPDELPDDLDGVVFTEPDSIRTEVGQLTAKSQTSMLLVTEVGQYQEYPVGPARQALS